MMDDCFIELVFLLSIRDVFIILQPYVVVFNSIIAMSMTLYIYLRTRPKRLKMNLLSPGTVIINWSGHPLPNSPWIVPYKIYTPSTPPHFNVESWTTLQNSVQKTHL